MIHHALLLRNLRHVVGQLILAVHGLGFFRVFLVVFLFHLRHGLLVALLIRLLLRQPLLLHHPLLHGVHLRGVHRLLGLLLHLHAGAALGMPHAFKPGKQAQAHLAFAHVQPRSVTHVQGLLAGCEIHIVHIDRVFAKRLNHQPALVVKAEPQMLSAHARRLHAQVVGARGTQRAFARHHEGIAGFQVARAGDDHHLADEAGVGQEFEPLFGLTAVLAVPAPAAPCDDEHQEQEPVARGLRDEFVDFCGHKGWSPPVWGIGFEIESCVT